MGIACGVIGKDGQPALLVLVHHIDPIDDEVLLDLVPSLEEGVGVTAAAYVIGGVLVNRAAREGHGEKRLEFPAAVVGRTPGLAAAVLRLDVPWVADPGVLV